MSRNGNKPKARAPYKQPVQKPANAPSVPGLLAMDGYSNAFARLGDASALMNASAYNRRGITQDYDLLVTMYRESWLCKKVVDTVAEDMTRSWYSLNSQLDDDRIKELQRMEARHNIKMEMTDALRWARLFGGAVAIMVIKGQEDMLHEPLDMDMIMPGCFRGLIVLDRWTGVQPGLSLVTDMDDPDFGLPEYYDVSVSAYGGMSLRVHHSRILRFLGRTLPVQEEELENYWGTSELEHIYEELNKRNATSANIAQLVFQANLRVMKMGDLGEFLSMATDSQQKRLYQTIQAEQMLLSSFGVQLLNKDDSYETHQYTFSGISDVYEAFMMDISGAAEIPATKLFGRSPAGMNATGESDLENYYEMIAQKQEAQLRTPIERLLPVMCMSLWGAVPDDIEIVFNDIRTMKPGDCATIGAQLTTAITGAFTSGVISQKTALSELRETGKKIGMWTKIADEDIDLADDEPVRGETEDEADIPDFFTQL